MNELQLITSREFNGHTLDCYVEPDQQDKGAFWATREQVGRLLEYENPNDAIAIIHHRHSGRLDKFSTTFNLKGEAGFRAVTVYSFKGLLEICRYSNQPKADAVMDWLWEVADEIRRTGAFFLGTVRGEGETGSYSVNMPAEDRDLRLIELENKRKDIDLERARFLQRMIEAPAFPLTDESKAVIGHEAFKLITGHEFLGMLSQVKEQWYTAGDIGTAFGISANMVGRIAKDNHLKPEQGESNKYGRWIFSKSRYSSREVPSFVYSEAAMDWFKQYQDGVCGDA